MSGSGDALIRPHHALRGLAALFVVLYHFRDVTPYLGKVIDEQTAFFTNGRVWVDFFFILSGFILSHVYARSFAAPYSSGRVSRAFYWARFARIYPLHLATLFAMIGVELSAYVARPAIADAFASDRKSWLSILQHLSLTHAWRSLDRLEWNVPSWSISTETLAYLCFPLLMLMVHRQKVIAITALSFAAAAIYAHTFVNYRDIGEQQPLLRCLAGFVAGILLHQLWQRYRDRLSMVISTMQIAAAVLAAVALHLNWSKSIIIAALACLILATAEGTGPLSRLLSKSPLRMV